MFRVLLTLIALVTFTAPAAAQVPGNGLSIFTACTQMGELVRGLDQVVNEMQLYNNSRDIWRKPRGCTFRDPRNVKIETVRFVGWYLTEPANPRDPQFWIPIYGVDFNETRPGKEILPGVTLRQETLMFRPHGAFRADRWELPRGCERQWVERPERYKPVRLHGTDRRGGITYCEKPDYVGKGFKESNRRGR